MGERYIRRGTLPPQRFAYNCPVILAAGALLEDTQQPRLVGQLKWGAPRGVVTSLKVTLHCEGARPEEVAFTYQDLRVLPGRPFGQYNAILLPSGTTGFRVTVEEVTFLDGTGWNRETARAQAEQAPKKTPDITAKPEKVVEAAPAVPTQESSTSKPAPKGKRTGLIAVSGLAVVLVLLFALFGRGDKPENPAAPGSNLPSAATKGPGTATADDSKPTSGGSSGGQTPGEGPSEGKPSSGTEAGSPPVIGPVQTVSSEDLGETGDIAAVYIHRDASGYFSLTPSSFVDYIPGCVTTCAWEVSDLGNDVLTYLKGSFSFAWYVGEEGPNTGMVGDETQYPEKDGGLPERVCVLAFGGEKGDELIGYFIGLPEEYDEDTIRIDMTLCKYSLLPLYEQERHAFLEGLDQLDSLPMVDADLVEDFGAQYCIPGYYTGNSEDWADDDCQRYHIWRVLNSLELSGLIRPVDRVHRQNNRNRYMFFLLLNKNYEPIGYTYSH